MIDRGQMVEILVDEFPELEDEIRDEVWQGLVHLEISCFARYTQIQIDSLNEPELKKCFEVARRLMIDADEESRNAIYVSYLEHLNFDDQKNFRSWALGYLPEPLHSGHRALQRQYD